MFLCYVAAPNRRDVLGLCKNMVSTSTNIQSVAEFTTTLYVPMYHPVMFTLLISKNQFRLFMNDDMLLCQVDSGNIPAVMEALEDDTSRKRKSHNVLNRNVWTATQMPTCKHSMFN